MKIAPMTTVDRVAPLDELFAQMARASLTHCRSVPELSAREQMFLNLLGHICQSALGLPYELHVRAALRTGLTTEDIRALLRLAGPEIGYSAALGALERLAEIVAAMDAPDHPAAGPLPSDLVTTGEDAPPSLLPERIRDHLRDLDPHFADYVELQSRMRTPDGLGPLTARERAFTAISIDIYQQTLGDAFRFHVDQALAAGASADDVRAVLRFNAQFGATRVWQAWPALNALLPHPRVTTGS